MPPITTGIIIKSFSEKLNPDFSKSKNLNDPLIDVTTVHIYTAFKLLVIYEYPKSSKATKFRIQ